MNWPFQFSDLFFKCPQCGHPMSNGMPSESLFYRVQCDNQLCGLADVSYVVEKSTRVVITASALGDENGEPMWPANWVNRAGEYVIRHGKPVLKIADDPISYGGQYRSSGEDAPSRATPRFDPADMAGISAANQAQQAESYPEAVEEINGELINNWTRFNAKAAIYRAYIAGMQSQEAAKLYAERMGK